MNQSYPNATYTIKDDHRDDTPNKSQWTISEDEERKTFRHTLDEGWIHDKHGWGLYFVDGRVAYLGKSEHRNGKREDAFIARFDDGNRNNHWHGCPVYPPGGKQNIPRPEILSKWCESGFLSRAKISKIAGGKRCRL